MHKRRQVFTANLTVAGRDSQSACTSASSNPCVAKLADFPAQLDIAEWSDHRLSSIQISSGCPPFPSDGSPGPAGQQTNDFLALVPAQTLQGMELDHPTFSEANKGQFIIDYSSNPPTASSSLRTAGRLGNSTIKYTGCIRDESAMVLEGFGPSALSLDFSWDPLGDSSCFGNGDTQVRVAGTRFVIEGSCESTHVGQTCDIPFAGCGTDIQGGRETYPSIAVTRISWKATSRSPEIELVIDPTDVSSGSSVAIGLVERVPGEPVTGISVQCPGGVSQAKTLALEALNNGQLSTLAFPGFNFTSTSCSGVDPGTYLVELTTTNQRDTGSFRIHGDQDRDGISDLQDNCPNAPNPGQQDADNDGEGDACDEDADADGDGIPNPNDNCPNHANPEQENSDFDELGDACDPDDLDSDNDGVEDNDDNCPDNFNPFQDDADGNGVGDACEPDIDGDGVPTLQNGQPFDNCPLTPNADQLDSDLVPDGFGDACDPPDGDGDGVPNVEDNCPQVENSNQRDSNADGEGDECDFDNDSDGDGVGDASDNCPAHANAGQEDSNNNGVGNVCETEDTDSDGHANFEDNCPFNFNPGQFDGDQDGIGDLCDPDQDSDGDGIPDGSDNCDLHENPGQQDTNNNGIGDACDPTDSDDDGLSDVQETQTGTDPNAPTPLSQGVNTYNNGQPTGSSNPISSGDTVGVAIPAADNITSIEVTVTDPSGDKAFEETLIPQSPVVFSFVADAPGQWTITAALYAGDNLQSTHVRTVTVLEVWERCTADFTGVSGVYRQFGGEHPAGCANWGVNSWWLAGTTSKLSGKNVSFNFNKRPVITSATIAFVRASRLVSVKAHNLGATAANVRLTCEGQPDVVETLTPNELQTIVTGWSDLCLNLSVTTPAGGDVNFDEFIIERPALSGLQSLISFNDKGQGNLNGLYPAGVMDWGNGRWLVSKPVGAFTSRSLSFRNGSTSATFSFAAGQEGIVESLQAYNSGNAIAQLKFECPGNSARMVSVPAGKVQLVATGWTSPCSTVTVTSSNGWETNFDNLLIALEGP